MKKLFKLSLLVLIICIMMIPNTYAITCNLTVQSTKNQVEKGEEFTVDFKISSIVSERGAIALTATLDYDKDSLTLVKLEGKNNWETPSEGSSYNSENGKIAISRNGLGKNDEVIFTATFKVKDGAKQNITVALKDVSISDATTASNMAKFEIIKKDFTLKTKGSETEKPSTDKPSTDKPSTDKPSTNKPSTSKPTIDTTTASDDRLPQTGSNVELWMLILGGIAISIAIYACIKMAIINRR